MTQTMQTVQTRQTLRDGYQGLVLLIDISLDRLLFLAAIGVALGLCTHLVTL